MRTTIVLLLVLGTFGATARAEDARVLHPAGELLEVAPNAYGLGVNSDQYGRPHVYRTPDGTPLPGIFTDGVERDAYGLGVHADEFGRVLRDDEP
jgi:hypothetical protein